MPPCLPLSQSVVRRGERTARQAGGGKNLTAEEAAKELKRVQAASRRLAKRLATVIVRRDRKSEHASPVVTSMCVSALFRGGDAVQRRLHVCEARACSLFEVCSCECAGHGCASERDWDLCVHVRDRHGVALLQAVL